MVPAASSAHPASTFATASIAFESNRSGSSDIYVLSGSGKQVDLTPNTPGEDSAPSWSPDGRRLAFASDRGGRYAIWVMSLDGSHAQLLTESKGLDVNPAWSPDGKTIAFTSNESGQWDVSVAGLDGSRRPLTTDAANEIDVSWSPQGDRVVFDRLDKGTADLWTVPLKGEARRLTETPGIAELNPAWSPSGDRIAFDASDENGRYDIYVLDVKTGKTSRLTNDRQDDSDPSWSPDGTTILFTREVKSDYELYSVNADGTGLRRLFKGLGGLDFAAAWQPTRQPSRLPSSRAPATSAAGPAPVFSCDQGYNDQHNGPHDPMIGTNSINYMCGNGGPDIIYGGGGADRISGGEGPDRLHGGTANDIIKARPEVQVPRPRDYVWGDAGSNNAWIGAEDWADRNTYCRL